ncbi:MAG TPA: glycosyl hydrolase family 28 protein [Tepidisphaeraceae bacterium]|nr:glycosyl hydrolase family 28 protein [Tepidisphaeraceae bacterium]
MPKIAYRQLAQIVKSGADLRRLLRFAASLIMLPGGIGTSMNSLLGIATLCFLVCACATASAADNGVFNVLDFGAKGNGKISDTVAIQKTIDACAAQGGGQVLLPAGRTYLSGTLTLRGNVDFHLAGGAILKGSGDWRDYLPSGSLLFAKDASNVTVSGSGTIDGNDAVIWQTLADEEAGGDINKEGWWPESFIGDWWPFGKKPGEPDQRGGRPMMIIFIGCDHVRMRDVTLTAAPSWTVHLVGCRDVAITEISIRNSWEVANNDGIDIDHCQDVRIANCLIDCADDGLVIKNTPNFEKYGDCQHITVTGCTLASRSAALKVDEIYTGTARDIIFDGCVVSRSNRGLCIQLRDAGNIENVIFSNIVVETKFQPHKWWGAGEPIQVTCFPRTAETKLGHVRNIRFSNVICRGENGLVFQGWPSSPLQDIVLDNVTLELTKAAPGVGGFYDLRPQGIFKGVYQTRLAGVYIREARDFALRNSRIVWDETGDKEYGPALDQENVEGFEMENVSFRPPMSGQ